MKQTEGGAPSQVVRASIEQGYPSIKGLREAPDMGRQNDQDSRMWPPSPPQILGAQHIGSICIVPYNDSIKSPK